MGFTVAHQNGASAQQMDESEPTMSLQGPRTNIAASTGCCSRLTFADPGQGSHSEPCSPAVEAWDPYTGLHPQYKASSPGFSEADSPWSPCPAFSPVHNVGPSCIDTVLPADIREKPCVLPHARHVFLCFGQPEQWPSSPVASSWGLMPRSLQAAVRAADSVSRHKSVLTVCEGRDDRAAGSYNGDVLLFPEGLLFRGLTRFDVQCFAEDALARPFSSCLRQRLRPEPITGCHVFVCCQSTPGTPCGASGPQVASHFAAELLARGITEHQVRIWRCCHMAAPGTPCRGNVVIFGSPQDQHVQVPGCPRGTLHATDQGCQIQQREVGGENDVPNKGNEDVCASLHEVGSGHWYTGVTPLDVRELVGMHILQSRVVGRLWVGRMRQQYSAELQEMQARTGGNAVPRKHQQRQPHQVGGVASAFHPNTLRGSQGQCLVPSSPPCSAESPNTNVFGDAWEFQEVPRGGCGKDPHGPATSFSSGRGSVSLAVATVLGSSSDSSTVPGASSSNSLTSDGGRQLPWENSTVGNSKEVHSLAGPHVIATGGYTGWAHFRTESGDELLFCHMDAPHWLEKPALLACSSCSRGCQPGSADRITAQCQCSSSWPLPCTSIPATASQATPTLGASAMAHTPSKGQRGLMPQHTTCNSGPERSGVAGHHSPGLSSSWSLTVPLAVAVTVGVAVIVGVVLARGNSSSRGS